MTKMPDSLDPTELLAQANPITNYEIDSAHLTQMVNRVTSTPVPSRFPLLRTWQMKASSAVAGAALVATGVVIAVSGAPQSLTVLALPSNTPIAGPAVHAPATLAPVTFESTQVPTASGTPSFYFGGLACGLQSRRRQESPSQGTAHRRRAGRARRRAGDWAPIEPGT
jgi:hypothetical protein